MSNILSYIRKINNGYNSSNQKESDIFSIKRNIEKNFRTSLDYESDTLVNGERQELLVLKTKEDNKKKIKSLPEESFNLGNIVDCYGCKWLITKLDANTQIQHSGKMEQCNYILNFLNSNNQPISRACIVENATKYNSGVKATSGEIKMNLGSSQYLIRLPYDSETALLDRTYPDGVDRRLLMDFGTLEPTAYTITQADRVTYPCLVALTLTESGRSTKDDNTTLMIADYYNRIASILPVGDYTIAFSGEPIIEVGKGFKTFTHNAPLTSIWKVITVSPEYDAYVISESANNYIKLKILDRIMIGQIVRLDLCDASNEVLTSLDLEARGIG